MLLRPRRLVVSAIASTTVALGLGAGALGSSAGTASTIIEHPVLALATNGAHANSTVQSSNWAGYDEGLLDTSTPFTSISAEWTIPTASQHTAGQAESSATWVGIGGGCVDMTSGCAVGDETLIQAGTEQDVSASGTASYSAWWEVLPAPSLTASVTVNPGDEVSVSITGPVLWTIDFKDLTNGNSFTESVPYPSPMDTAEWIEEAPVVISTSGSASAGEATLPNLTAADFQLATLNGKSPRLVPAYEIQMVSSTGQVLATPSAPTSGGNGFNVCTYASTC
ncbi:MAG TPA: G1 family glutamic endopeptidase [Acidimicrobiales bacterium]|nr:G1 family glutamic endopeptidase [Acidimicrobiales bacterium]